VGQYIFPGTKDIALNAKAPPITAKRAIPDKINLAFVIVIVAFINQKAKLK
jgi:hypothetical protein